jgi:hypothetical protein
MRVKNLNGTSKNKCKCGSWLAHWQRYSQQTANHCVVIGCTGKDLVGGHVQKDSPYDSSWFIIPICNTCNLQQGQTLTVVDEVNLVSANVAQTCG